MSLAAAVLLLGVGAMSLVAVGNATRPSKRWWLLVPSWAAAFIVTELAWHLLAVLALSVAVAAALGALEGPVGWVAMALSALAALGALRLAVQGMRTRVQVRQAFTDLEVSDDAPRFPLAEILMPWRSFDHPGVEVTKGVQYAEHDGRRLRLDVYEPPGGRPPGARRPVVVQVHGGGWIAGTRTEQGVPLLNHLARQGWVGFNIDYRLSPHATMPEPVIDVKRAIAWIRENADDYGADPDFVCITGGSAGGHLAALAALTAGDESLQPGFEQADTSVAAAVPFYGVYDLLDEGARYAPELYRYVLEPIVFKARRADDPESYRRASPTHRVHEEAPPFLVIHGDSDSLVPVDDARAFVERLRETSREPVVYLEMRGAQHAFDILPSPRTARVIEAIERFLAVVREGGGQSTPRMDEELDESLR